MVVVDIRTKDAKVNEIRRSQNESSWCGPLGNGPGIATAAQ